MGGPLKPGRRCGRGGRRGGRRGRRRRRGWPGGSGPSRGRGPTRRRRRRHPCPRPPPSRPPPPRASSPRTPPPPRSFWWTGPAAGPARGQQPRNRREREPSIDLCVLIGWLVALRLSAAAPTWVAGGAVEHHPLAPPPLGARRVPGAPAVAAPAAVAPEAPPRRRRRPSGHGHAGSPGFPDPLHLRSEACGSDLPPPHRPPSPAPGKATTQTPTRRRSTHHPPPQIEPSTNPRREKDHLSERLVPSLFSPRREGPLCAGARYLCYYSYCSPLSRLLPP